MEREEFPEVLLAHDFNTMELFNFDRDTRSDRILYSEYLLYLLFNLMMGPEPNVWTPSNTQDALPSLNFSDSESFDKLYKVFSNSKTPRMRSRTMMTLQMLRDSVLLVIAISQNTPKL